VVEVVQTNKNLPGDMEHGTTMALCMTTKKIGRKCTLPAATPVQCKDCHKMTTMHKSMVSPNAENIGDTFNEKVCVMYVYALGILLYLFPT